MIVHIKRTIRGELSLIQTYWLHGALGWLVGFFVLSQQRSIDAVFWAIAAVWFAFVLCACFATWRSANRYTGARTWARIAKTPACLATLSVPALVLLLWIYVGYYERVGWPQSSP